MGVIRKLLLIAAAASLVGLAAAPGALAGAGLLSGRATASPSRPAPASPLIAPPGACPDQSDLKAPAEVQEQAMRCMIEFARAGAGLNELSDSQELDLSAREKAGDVLRCDSFSHFACDREFTYWMRQVGYLSQPCWHTGENLAWGTGAYGTVRSIFQAWMRSPGHRHNILGDYEDLGLGLQVGELGGLGDVDVWAAHFGSHCGAPMAAG
jgi:uncharacterized protein YkwD